MALCSSAQAGSPVVTFSSLWEGKGGAWAPSWLYGEMETVDLLPLLMNHVQELGGVVMPFMQVRLTIRSPAGQPNALLKLTEEARGDGYRGSGSILPQSPFCSLGQIQRSLCRAA